MIDGRELPATDRRHHTPPPPLGLPPAPRWGPGWRVVAAAAAAEGRPTVAVVAVVVAAAATFSGLRRGGDFVRRGRGCGWLAARGDLPIVSSSHGRDGARTCH